MKLVYISPGYIPVLSDSARSVETSIYLLTKAMAKLNHKVTVLDIKTKKPRKGTGCSYYELWTPSIKGSNLISYLFKILSFTFQLPLSLYRYWDADIVQVYSQFPAAMLVIVKKLLRLKYRMVYLTCSPYLVMPKSLSNTLKHTLIEGWVLRRVDKLLVHTSYVAERLVERFKVNPSKISLVYAGIDLEGINKLSPVTREQALIFYPAVITPRKNQLVIIKSLPEIMKVYPDCKVILAGIIEDKVYYNMMQCYIEKNGLSNIIFTGILPKSEVYEYYQRATLMIFPTLFEMQGIILAEAMAFKVPVIASDIKVLRSIVKSSPESALFINPNNTDSIAEAVIELLGNSQLRNKIADKGYKLVSSEFSWNKVARKMAGLYEEFCR